MKFFFKDQSESLRRFWQDAYRHEVGKTVFVGLVLLLCGYAVTMAKPELADRYIDFFVNTVALEDLVQLSGFSLMWEILLNNLSAAFTAVLWGAIPFLYLPTFSLALNFFLVGVMGAYSMQIGLSLGFYLIGILPHGIFEFPALIFACAAGLTLCRSITNRMRRREDMIIPDAITGCVSVYWLLLLPLLILAALVEVFITPTLLGFAM